MRVQILKTDLFLRGDQCKEMRVGVRDERIYECQELSQTKTKRKPPADQSDQ